MSNEKVFSLTEEPSLTKTGDIRNADVTLQLLEKHGHEFGSLTPEATAKKALLALNDFAFGYQHCLVCTSRPF
jgi:hypothetical protein